MIEDFCISLQRIVGESKNRQSLDKKIVANLLKAGYIEQRGKTGGTYYILGKDYYEMSGRLSEYSKLTDRDENQVLSMVSSFLKKNKSPKMGDFASSFSGHLSRKQIQRLIKDMREEGLVERRGSNRNGKWIVKK